MMVIRSDNLSCPNQIEWPQLTMMQERSRPSAEDSTLACGRQVMQPNAQSNSQQLRQQTRQMGEPPVPLNCPRCESTNTKFCYYNNYSLSQPRHFCKNCRRYWTKGGALRNVPVGGGCRKKDKRTTKQQQQQQQQPQRSNATAPSSATELSGMTAGLIFPPLPPPFNTANSLMGANPTGFFQLTPDEMSHIPPFSTHNSIQPTLGLHSTPFHPDFNLFFQPATTMGLTTNTNTNTNTNPNPNPNPNLNPNTSTNTSFSLALHSYDTSKLQHRINLASPKLEDNGILLAPSPSIDQWANNSQRSFLLEPNYWQTSSWSDLPVGPYTSSTVTSLL